MKNYNLQILIKKPEKNKEKLVGDISKKVEYDKEIGYAGYKNKEDLKKFLVWSIYGDEQKNIWKEINENKISVFVSVIMEKCSSFLTENKINIFIFPTINKFVIENMEGVSGFTPWKNTILINLNPTKNWEKAFEGTLAHELAHALCLNYNEWSTLRDSLVFEGIAENFKEGVVGGSSPWVNTLTKKEAFLIFNKIKKFLDSKDEGIYNELFFGSKDYPKWSGYAVGYYLVKDYLKKLKNVGWNEIMKMSPKDIIPEQ